jgi:hypothetical protein
MRSMGAKSVRRSITLGLTVLGSTLLASAQISIIAWNPNTSFGLSSVLPYVDGVAVPITWAPTDMTSCMSGSPPTCMVSFSFSTFNSSLSPYLSPVVCGANLPGRGGGHPCIIDIDARAVSNPTANSDTPTYVFGSLWEGYLGLTSPQDAAFCTPDYPGNTSAIPPPPPSPGGYSNITTTNCGSSLCLDTTVATGIPAVWETPFVAAVDNWWTALITWASGNSVPLAPVSQIGYIRFGFSIGSEASIDCTKYLELALGGGTLSGDSAMKTQWLSSYAAAASYISTQRAAQYQASTHNPTWVPMMTVNMGTSLTNPSLTTDPSWSIGEAQILLANQPFGIGTQGLENGFVGSAVVSDIQSMSSGPSCGLSGYGPCCSDNWCNVRQIVIGNVPVIELQDCNISNPAGGTKNCLDSAMAGTTTADQLTLAQVFTISSQHGTTSAEIYYNDLLCAFDPGATPIAGSNCALNPGTYSTPYASAVLALAAGQPSGTSALIGNAQILGGATMF